MDIVSDGFASEVILEMSVRSRREITAGSWKATANEFGSVAGRELEREELRKKSSAFNFGFLLVRSAFVIILRSFLCELSVLGLFL
jgi:hypothetical protein